MASRPLVAVRWGVIDCAVAAFLPVAIAHDVVHEQVKTPLAAAATTRHNIGILQGIVDCDYKRLSRANLMQSQLFP